MQLSDYGLSRERGFLSHYEIDEIALPTQFDEVKAASADLSGLLSTGRVRHWLDQISDPGVEDWAREAPEEEVRTAMVHYSFLVQAYVWGEPQPPAHLPANLSRPMVAIADRLGQAPLLPYSAYVLDNWARLDKSGADHAGKHPHGPELPRRGRRELVRDGPRCDRSRSRRSARQRGKVGRRRGRR
jgi:indoleamine 2,3-dioxygenase